MIKLVSKSQRVLLIRNENASGKEAQSWFDWQVFFISFSVIHKTMLQSYHSKHLGFDVIERRSEMLQDPAGRREVGSKREVGLKRCEGCPQLQEGPGQGGPRARGGLWHLGGHL